MLFYLSLDGFIAIQSPMDSWETEGWDSEDFVVELQENSDPASSEPPSSKRRNSRATPERFRCPAAAAAAGHQAVAAGSSGGSTAMPALRQQHVSQVQPDSEQKPSTGGRGWSVRSIFMARQPDSPPRLPLQQLVPAPVPPTGERSPRSPGLGAYSCGIADEDDCPGPLTQMAAAHASVATAFCPTCGTFLADLGGPQEQAAHTAACCTQRSQRGAAAEGAAAACSGRPQQGQEPQHHRQQQQQQDPDAAGAGPATAEEGSEERGGNWSEHEEASQAAAECGVASAAVSEHGEAAAASEDGWDGGGGEAEAAGPAGGAGAGSDEQAGLHAWLEGRGLAKYSELFARAGEGHIPCCCGPSWRIALAVHNRLAACLRTFLPELAARCKRPDRGRTCLCCRRRRPVAAAVPH